jgi:hypothetical protein
MRLPMIASFAALVTSVASLATVVLMTLCIPTQVGTGLPWTADLSRSIPDAATVTFHKEGAARFGSHSSRVALSHKGPSPMTTTSEATDLAADTLAEVGEAAEVQYDAGCCYPT